MKFLNFFTFIFLLFSIQVVVAQPDWQFANSFGQSEDPNYSSTDITSIATDSEGNYFVGGHFDGTITGEGFYFYDEDVATQFTGMVVAFNSAGEYIWHHQIWTTDGTQYTEASIKGVATDSNGDVYVTGMFCGTAEISETISISSVAVGGYSTFIVKYNGTDGTPLWAEAASTSNSVGYGVIVDSNDNVYTTGYFQGTATFGDTELTTTGEHDVFVAKYDSNGNGIWASKLGSTGVDMAYSIATDNNDNVFVLAKYSGTPTIGSTTLPDGESATHIFVAKANASGVWQNAVSFTSSSFGYYHDIDCDNNGNVFLAGDFNTDIDFGGGSESYSNHPGYLAKYDNSLVYQWNNIMNPDENDSDNGTFALKTDDDNNVIVIGSFNGTLDFGSGITIEETQAHQCPYIAKFDNDGVIQYAQGFYNQSGGFGSNGYAIDVVGNSIFAAGDLKNPINIGTLTVASPDDAKYIWVASDFMPLSSNNDILTFVLAEQTGDADIDDVEHTIEIEVVNGTNVAELTPTITISANATINPETGTQQNFTDPFEYTVTAENSEEQIWTVTVTEATSLSSDNDILTFVLAEQTGDADIDDVNHTIAIEVVNGTNVAELTPTIMISENATINPETGTQQNFTDPFEYTVTAENSEEQIWTVTVTIINNINSIKSNDFIIYPNPSNGIFTIETSKFQNFTNSKIVITDITGKIIFSKDVACNVSTSQFDLSNQSKGIYFIKINTETGIYTEKLIIQ